jgi:hypothetical protein
MGSYGEGEYESKKCGFFLRFFPFFSVFFGEKNRQKNEKIGKKAQ